MDDQHDRSWKDTVSLLAAAVLILGSAVPAALAFVGYVAPRFLDIDKPLVGWEYGIGFVLLVGLLAAMSAAGFLGSLAWIVLMRPLLDRKEAERWIFFGPGLRVTDWIYTRILDGVYDRRDEDDPI